MSEKSRPTGQKGGRSSTRDSDAEPTSSGESAPPPWIDLVHTDPIGKFDWERLIDTLPCGMNASQHNVLATLAHGADNKTGRVIIGAVKLGERAGVGERQVRRVLDWATASGLIIRDRRGHHTRPGAAVASRYFLAQPDISTPAVAESQPDIGESQPDIGTSQPVMGVRLSLPTGSLPSEGSLLLCASPDSNTHVRAREENPPIAEEPNSDSRLPFTVYSIFVDEETGEREFLEWDYGDLASAREDVAEHPQSRAIIDNLTGKWLDGEPEWWDHMMTATGINNHVVTEGTEDQ